MALSKEKQEEIEYQNACLKVLMVELIDQVFSYLENRQPADSMTLESIQQRLTDLEGRVSATSDRVALRHGFGVGRTK